MKPSELKTALSALIPLRMPVLITGAPGIGKTDIVGQAFDSLDYDHVSFFPAIADPTDFKGFPMIVDGKPEFMTFGEMDVMFEADRPTGIFFDDLGQAPTAVQAALMQPLLARRINGRPISDHITFIAATNERHHKAGVSGLLEPVKSRFGTIVRLEPDLDEFIAHAIQHSVDPMIGAFLRFTPESLHDFQPTADMVNSPCPRTWFAVDKILKARLSGKIEYECLSGAIGEGTAVKLISFLKMARQLPSVDRIFLDPDGVDVPEEPSVMHAVCGALSHRATADNFDAVVRYLKRCDDEFSVLCVKNVMNGAQYAEIRETDAWLSWVTGQGKVII